MKPIVNDEALLRGFAAQNRTLEWCLAKINDAYGLGPVGTRLMNVCRGIPDEPKEESLDIPTTEGEALT